jgi:hypothetical protein
MNIGQIFDSLNSKFSKLYHPTGLTAVEEVIILFKEEAWHPQDLHPPPLRLRSLNGREQ